MSGKLTVPGAPDNAQWRDIVEHLTNELTDDVPDQVLRATELMLSGFTKAKTAKAVGVTVATLESWIRRYPTVAHVLAENRKYLQLWRMAQLEQQFLKALEKSNDILELSFEDSTVNQKLVATIAQHARYIIGLFAAQQIDVNVKATADEPLLKARMDALDYIAQQMQIRKNSDDPITVDYRVDDDRSALNRMLLNELGEPRFGSFGVLDTNEEGALCHICGERQQVMGPHVSKVHDMRVQDYERLFILDDGTLHRFDNTSLGE